MEQTEVVKIPKLIEVEVRHCGECHLLEGYICSKTVLPVNISKLSDDCPYIPGATKTVVCFENYGVWRYSDALVDAFAKLKGREWHKQKLSGWQEFNYFWDDDNSFIEFDREDKDFIEAVKTAPCVSMAHPEGHHFKAYTFPAHEDWTITDYDGAESIKTKSRDL